jgi:glutamate synthase domain-containing protein 2/glutamate synthase domain-containing protein 1/glutamate synthase domain-containing protein 3
VTSLAEFAERDACGVGFVARLDPSPSHAVLQAALAALRNLAHRGAQAADGRTGDGAGVLTEIPHGLFGRVLREMGYRGDERPLAVGVFFFPASEDLYRACRAVCEEEFERGSLRLLGWRTPPVQPKALGEYALRTLPRIQQALLTTSLDLDGEALERHLYLVRRRIEKRAGPLGLYVPSLSARTVVYKALVSAPQLERFYLDLQDQDFAVRAAVFHQRYSTNTNPSWPLAQPFRLLAHNGEINTLLGNVNWMRAREGDLSSGLWQDRLRELLPVIQEGGSDSAMLDNVLELLRRSGRDLPHALRMLVPEAWEGAWDLDAAARGFYRYHACLAEPWDGPAALAFFDGVTVGMALDRNGLRPARYTITRDGLVVAASEVGVLPIAPGRVVERGRLGPGEMVVVDLEERRFLHHPEVRRRLSSRRPYARWAERLVRVDPKPKPRREAGDLDALHLAFGYTKEDLQRVLQAMAAEGKDAVGSMGDDTPPSALSSQPRLLYQFFRQRFAQVTNPPIDPLRERLVMSLEVRLGARRSFLEEGPEHADLVELPSPVLPDLDWLEEVPLQPRYLDATFEADRGERGLEEALERLCREAAAAVREGCTALVLSDRGLSRDRAPIPALLATAAVHHHLIREGLRLRTALLVETGEAREVHHVACLVGYGAEGVYPYLALDTAEQLSAGGAANLKKALEAGLLKVMAKMGIAPLQAYCGAQIFETVGLDRALVDRYFPGTPNHAPGVGLEALARDVLERHAAYRRALDGEPATVPDVGFYRYRHGGEYHGFEPDVVKAIHRVSLNGSGEYPRLAELVGSRPPQALRDLLEIRPAGPPVPLEEVEPAENILRRFVISAMSHGALSREAHETLAIAANRLGMRSNSGEGGEDPARRQVRPNGDWPNTTIKQVASGRFGVTAGYLRSAVELEIKMAQGSKPGEGGQLLGHKVTEEIARLRKTQPGTTLISPPPHHDIYSIEDLAQLIYDLKQVHPTAHVAVKLVATTGVGTIASGVAKGFADVVQISGHEGGTGASPLDSIKNAGLPWEVGLSEARRALAANGLRGRVRVRVDGGFKVGRDVVLAALLGADEFGFGTAALVALGCVMARQCHSNTCPVGIATQREDLRSKFPGTPERVEAYFRALAEDVRRHLAQMGVRSLDEIIGRVDLLRVREDVRLHRAERLDLTEILRPAEGERCGRFADPLPVEGKLNRLLVEQYRQTVEHGVPAEGHHPITNRDRTVGATLAGEIAARWGDEGLPEGTLRLTFEGAAGQSFGAFCVPGMHLRLVGEANDYVGKGMSGGEIVVVPPPPLHRESWRHVIVGNTVLYGATGGVFFAAGRAGERFAVRNSGAVAVVEGAGDHCCEYMTGGVVVVLGPVGRNFGAGMTGGRAYVLDEAGVLDRQINADSVQTGPLSDPEAEELRALLVRYHEATGSHRARSLLRRWDRAVSQFRAVRPRPAAVAAQAPAQTSGLARRAR